MKVPSFNLSGNALASTSVVTLAVVRAIC